MKFTDNLCQRSEYMAKFESLNNWGEMENGP